MEENFMVTERLLEQDRLELESKIVRSEPAAPTVVSNAAGLKLQSEIVRSKPAATADPNPVGFTMGPVFIRLNGEMSTTKTAEGKFRTQQKGVLHMYGVKEKVEMSLVSEKDMVDELGEDVVSELMEEVGKRVFTEWLESYWNSWWPRKSWWFPWGKE